MPSEFMRRLMMGVLGGGAAANPLIAGVACPAITPTVGPTELLTNPGFEGTYDTEATGIDIAPSWSKQSLADPDTASKEATTKHGGSASQKFVTGSANRGVVHDTNVLAANKWYQFSFWGYLNSGAAIANMRDTITFALITTNNIGTIGNWVQSKGTGRATAAGSVCILGGAGWTGQVDDASCMEIDFASMITRVGTWAARDGTYICHPTAAANTQAGMLLAYADATHFVHAYIDRVSNTAKLLKRVGAGWISVISAAFTYSAGAELKVIVSGTDYALYYNGAQIGTAQAILDATLGYDVYGFNSMAGNTVGTVTVNP